MIQLPGQMPRTYHELPLYIHNMLHHQYYTPSICQKKQNRSTFVTKCYKWKINKICFSRFSFIETQQASWDKVDRLVLLRALYPDTYNANELLSICLLSVCWQDIYAFCIITFRFAAFFAAPLAFFKFFSNYHVFIYAVTRKRRTQQGYVKWNHWASFSMSLENFHVGVLHISCTLSATYFAVFNLRRSVCSAEMRSGR